jgi:hypothetical protein
MGLEGYGFAGSTFDIFSVCRRNSLFVFLSLYFFIISIPYRGTGIPINI